MHAYFFTFVLISVHHFYINKDKNEMGKGKKRIKQKMKRKQNISRCKTSEVCDKYIHTRGSKRRYDLQFYLKECEKDAYTRKILRLKFIALNRRIQKGRKRNQAK